MPLFVKIESGIVRKAVFDRYVSAHKDYVRALNQQGRNAKTGYWRNSPGGMLIFEAASMDEAREIVENDPLIKNGCVTYELHEWRVVID